MKAIVDTNVLVRAATLDDPEQGALARSLMEGSELVAVTLPALCEFCWVLSRAYGYGADEIAASIGFLLDASNVALDRQAVEAGLALLNRGGDFADGVIAHDGQWLGGEHFLSFDKKAVRLLQEAGEAASILART